MIAADLRSAGNKMITAVLCKVEDHIIIAVLDLVAPGRKKSVK